MSTKKMQKSLDKVKSDVRGLTEAFWALRDEMMTQQAANAAEQQSSTSQESPASVQPEGPVLPDSADAVIGTHGSYALADVSGGTQVHRWAIEDLPAEDALAVPLEETARLLAAIGHKQRLRITLLLLRSPATASDIVEKLSLGTTGAAYHHLNVLQGAGLVEQPQRGTFSIAQDIVPALMAMLAGLSGAVQSSVEIIPAEETDVEGGTEPAE